MSRALTSNSPDKVARIFSLSFDPNRDDKLDTMVFQAALNQVEKKGKSIVFNGQGYGHHLGICQWGAKNIVDAGWNYTSILEFYYPGTVIMQLKNSTTT